MTSSTTPPHGRELRGRNPQIRAGEYLVYHLFAKTFIRCAPNGDALDGFNETGYVFDDLSKAQDYCRWKVSGAPKLGCLIYDKDWRIVEQFTNPQYMEQISRAQSPKRRFVKGVLFLLAGVAFLGLEAHFNWMLMVGFLVGARLAVGGVVQIALSIIGQREDSARQ